MNSAVAIVTELFEAVKERLSADDVLQAILRQDANYVAQKNRVYLYDEDHAAEEGPQDKPWGRVVILGMQNLFDSGVPQSPSELKEVGVLVRIEFNNFTNPGYRVSLSIERAHLRAYERLYRWVPTELNGAPLTGLMVALGFYRSRDPHPAPLWDEERGLWYASAEYRVEITSITP